MQSGINEAKLLVSQRSVFFLKNIFFYLFLRSCTRLWVESPEQKFRSYPFFDRRKLALVGTFDEGSFSIFSIFFKIFSFYRYTRIQ